MLKTPSEEQKPEFRIHPLSTLNVHQQLFSKASNYLWLDFFSLWLKVSLPACVGCKGKYTDKPLRPQFEKYNSSRRCPPGWCSQSWTQSQPKYLQGTAVIKVALADCLSPLEKWCRRSWLSPAAAEMDMPEMDKILMSLCIHGVCLQCGALPFLFSVTHGGRSGLTDTFSAARCTGWRQTPSVHESKETKKG